MTDAKTPTFLEQVTAMADQLKLEGDERDGYIHQHMTKAGYKAVPTYILPDEENKKPANIFGGKGDGWFKTG